MVSGAWVRAGNVRRVGVIAAMAGELKPLVQGWKPLRARQGAVAWQGTIDGSLCIAVCAGMGKLAAERACAIAAEGGPLDALVSVGWAGALSCGMHPGSAYVLNEVVDEETGGVFPTNSPPREREAPPLKLVTIDHVAHVADDHFRDCGRPTRSQGRGWVGAAERRGQEAAATG